METEGVEEEKANYPATDDAPTKIAPSAGFELPKFHFSMSKSSQPTSKSVTGEASMQKSAVDNEAEWWDKVKDDVDSGRTGIYQYQLIALTAAERNEKQRIAADAAGDTKLAALIQKEIALWDASAAEMEESEEIERRAKQSQRDAETMPFE